VLLCLNSQTDKKSFPEIKGLTKANAQAYVHKVNPNIHVVFMGPNDMVTRDLQMNRLRVVVDPATGLVTSEAPNLG